jgi:hypothetical protein
VSRSADVNDETTVMRLRARVIATFSRRSPPSQLRGPKLAAQWNSFWDLLRHERTRGPSWPAGFSNTVLTSTLAATSRRPKTLISDCLAHGSL